ncbi:MAG: hypothetical protein CL678_07765 [Bdellovibrionaceae bacterium]|nr:hypothetical protein [Pseudobdellovibrionaceae bacterium]|tara:strand:- start:1931 stop:2842 length:912 start_codon:yes stop_codon:yes gene_type:complete
MTGFKKTEFEHSFRNYSLWFLLHSLWAGLILILVFWWYQLLKNQSLEIFQLKIQLGIEKSIAKTSLFQFENMIFWETISFTLILFFLVSLGFFIFLKDYRRRSLFHTFLLGLTHELKTPLTGIRLQMEALKEDYPEEVLIDRLQTDLNRLESQVLKTLQLSRIFSESKNAEKIEITSTLKRWAKNKKIQITGIAESIYFSELSFDLILSILYDNSKRHSKSQKLEIKIDLDSNSKYQFLTFTDNGKGSDLSPKEITRLFNKGKTSSGTGIGLYLVKRLVEEAGGAVDIIPRPHFSVKIKLKKA